MKKILIVAATCFGKASSNGLCAMSLKRALETAGCETYILGFCDQNGIGGDKNDKSYDIGMSYRDIVYLSRNNTFFTTIKSMFICHLNKYMVDCYYEKALNLYNEFHFDAIIPMYFNPEFIVVARKLKKNFPKIKVLIYELDSATDGISNNNRIALLNKMAHRRFMEKQYKIADRIYILNPHMAHVEKTYSSYLNKVTAVDTPILIRHNASQKNNKKLNVNFFYTGVLDLSYRSPEKLLRIFRQIRDKINWRMHFYSKGNCEDMLKNEAKDDCRIVQHGYVSSDELEIALDKADILINIGNTNSNSLPSKLIDYISRGKPIIHISLQNEDVCLDYLNRYPLGLVLKEEEKDEICSEQVISFVNAKCGKQIPFSLIENLYYMNTPEYSAKMIIKAIE